MAVATKPREVLSRLRSDDAFWARKCFHIVDKATGEVVPLVFNEAQRRVRAAKSKIRDDSDRVRLIILKARQGGITTGEQADNLHCIWANPHTTVMTLADTRQRADEIFLITRRAIKNFPKPLLGEIGSARTREVSFPERDSRFWTETAGSQRAGQSVTLTQLHGSEFSYWDDPLDTLQSASPALERPGTSIVLETTASTRGSEAHGFWREAERGNNGYHTLFLPWWICDYELYRLPLDTEDELGDLEPEEVHLVERHGLDLEQIKWRRYKIREIGDARFKTEYAEDPDTCWLVAGDLFFDGDRLKALLDSAPEPKRIQKVRVGEGSRTWNGDVKFYSDNEGFEWEREKVVLGADVAEGGGGDRDDSTFVARTWPSYRLLATFSSNTIEPSQFAELLNHYAREYFDTPYMVIEKNGHGITVLRELRDTWKYPLTRLYQEVHRDRPNTEPKMRLGWVTTESSKHVMLDSARHLFHLATDGENDVQLSEEAVRDAFDVERDKNGKVDLNGRDLLVAEMLCWQGRGRGFGEYGSFTEAI